MPVNFICPIHELRYVTLITSVMLNLYPTPIDKRVELDHTYRIKYVKPKESDEFSHKIIYMVVSMNGVRMH